MRPITYVYDDNKAIEHACGKYNISDNDKTYAKYDDYLTYGIYINDETKT